jgi:hypothetical protein
VYSRYTDALIKFRNFSAAKTWALMVLCLADLSFLAKFAACLRRSENKTTQYLQKPRAVASCLVAHFLRKFSLQKALGERLSSKAKNTNEDKAQRH